MYVCVLYTYSYSIGVLTNATGEQHFHRPNGAAARCQRAKRLIDYLLFVVLHSSVQHSTIINKCTVQYTAQFEQTQLTSISYDDFVSLNFSKQTFLIFQ